MSRCTVTLCSNAGISLTLDGVRFLVDVFHGASGDFAAMPEETWDHPDFIRPDGILYTHCHLDHFSLPAAQRAQRMYPDAVLAVPEPKLDGQLQMDMKGTFSVGAITVHYRQLPHIGCRPTYAHVGYMLESEEARVLIAGDCMLPCRELEDLLQKQKISLALLNWPWVATPRRRKYIHDIIKARHVLLHHFPAIGEAAQTAPIQARSQADSCTEITSIGLLTEPFQRVTFEGL